MLKQFKYVSITVVVLFSLLCPSFADEPLILRHGGVVRTVQYSPVDNSLIASAGDNTVIKLWNLEDNTATELRGHRGIVNSVAFSPDGKLLASGCDDWTFKLWDVRTQQNTATLEHIADGYTWGVKVVAFSPNGKQLATAGGRHAKLWDLQTQTEIATLQHDEDEYLWALVFSPNGQLVATGAAGGTVTIWDIQKREVIKKLDGDSRWVNALVFSPDGRTLVSAGYDGKIKLWKVADWTLTGTLENWGTAYDLDFSLDGKVLASASYTRVILWSVENGEQLTSLTGDAEWVHSVNFSPDSKTLASSGDDGTVRVQNIESYLQPLQQRKMVRLIYFLPNNRMPQPDVAIKLDTLIKNAQQFYAEQMDTHGFGRKTFTFETDTTGRAVVHQVNGKFANAYYNNDTLDKVLTEISEKFDVSKNIYLISIDIASERIDDHMSCGRGGVHGAVGGQLIIPASGACFDGDFGIDVAAHELGHAFGLQHDFRNDAYLMSYGSTRDQLSHCAAEWLNVHRYFNTNQTYFNQPTTIKMHTPIALPPNTIRVSFEVTDADGLHQAQLQTTSTDPEQSPGYPKLIDYKSLSGESSIVEFMTTQVTSKTDEVILQFIDSKGNFTLQTFSIEPNDIGHVDVNSDGKVNVIDLVMVALNFNTIAVRNAALNPDINRDGYVDRHDILLVIEALEALEPEEDNPAAPTLTDANLQRWITEAKQQSIGIADFQRGIAVLEQLLTPPRPAETALLPNYPNPFNPETWIPYQLAKPAEVILTIYAANGQVIRTLELGTLPAGIYQTKNRAAYWDGKNSVGEPVASGVYFYTLTAGDFTATRKMLIRK